MGGARECVGCFVVKNSVVLLRYSKLCCTDIANIGGYDSLCIILV